LASDLYGESLISKENSMFFLTGHHATGKTEAAEALVRTGSYTLVDTGPLMRKEHLLSDSGMSFGDWVNAGEYRHGPDFTNERLLRAMEPALTSARKRGQSVILAGFRSLAGIRYVQSRISCEGSGRAAIVFIETPPIEVLHSRWMAREGREITLCDFRALLERDSDMGVGRIRQAADFRVTNNGDLSSFELKMHLLAEGLRGTISSRFSAFTTSGMEAQVA
jgi:dephospho-CoA kinase